MRKTLKDECPADALRACVFIYLPYILKNQRRLIYTKDCSDTEGYKSQTNFVAQKMATSEVLSAQCVNR